MNATTSTTTTALLHLLHTYPSSHQLWPPRNPSAYSLSSQNLNLSSHILFTRSRRWDSNAETSRTTNFKFNSRENDDDDDDYDDDDDDTGLGERRRRRRRRSWRSDDSSTVEDSEFGVLGEFFDSVWIFKAFKSYGWALPFIISSLLLATGPKAFLMALALPLGQSALSLAFEKLYGTAQNKKRRKSRTKRKPRARSASNDEFEEEAIEGGGIKKGKMGYRSWVPRNDVSGDKSDKDASSFGGWDELDKQREFEMESRRRSAQKDGKLRRRVSVEKGKMGRRVGRSEMPLLLRLLIAVFPFLGSWTRML